MKIRDYIYQNKANENKFIVVRRYADGHYAWKQYLQYCVPGSMSRTVVNYTGCSLRRAHKGVWQRVSKSTMLSIIEDYTLMFSTAMNVHYL